MNKGDIVDEKWKIVGKLGKGIGGHVHEVVGHTGSGTCYALKVCERERQWMINNEIKVLKLVKKIGINLCSLIVDDGWFRGKRYLVMEKYGISVGNLLEKMDVPNLSPLEAAFLALKSLDCLEEFHKSNYVHLDIYSYNFCFDTENPRRLILIDFGTAEAYIKCRSRKVTYYTDIKTLIEHVLISLCCFLEDDEFVFCEKAALEDQPYKGVPTVIMAIYKTTLLMPKRGKPDYDILRLLIENFLTSENFDPDKDLCYEKFLV